jgi:hypothetical protein
MPIQVPINGFPEKGTRIQRVGAARYLSIEPQLILVTPRPVVVEFSHSLDGLGLHEE